MSYGLTKRQGELLSFLISHIDIHGFAPTYDQMAKALGVRSKSGIHRMIECLEERGYIKRIPAKVRSIKIVNNPSSENTSSHDLLLRIAGNMHVWSAITKDLKVDIDNHLSQFCHD